MLLSLFASAGQVLGLLVLSLGGGWAVRRRMHGQGASQQGASRAALLTTIGLLLATGTAFVFYYLHVQDETNQRLRTNLTRVSTQNQKTAIDNSLKTLDYSGQLEHPRGIETDQLAEWLGDGCKFNLLDVRETEEVEVGAIPGTWARRYPDLDADRNGLMVPGEQTILLCESGNRSSELSDKFFKDGIVTSFLIGGYEKWMAERRPMTGLAADARDDIRAIADYPNKQNLLDTAAAVQQFTDDQVLFVDVRYPADFATGHLPGAVNMTIRKLRTAEVTAAIAALPRRPIMVPCYDKRSSFFGLVLGLKLTRAGFDYRGRYTVPHEFSLPSAESEWIQRWRQDRDSRTLLASDANPAVGLSQWLFDRTGSLLLAVLLLVFLLRVLVAPLAWLADRDQQRLRRMAPAIAALRQRTDDPVVQQKTRLALMRRSGVNPLLNLIGALVQIMLFTLAFAAVDKLAADNQAGLGWLLLGQPDPLWCLPVLFGGLLLAYLRYQGEQPRFRWWHLLFAGAMVALVGCCRAAVQIYLFTSVALLFLQILWLRARARPARQVADTSRLPSLAAAANRPELGNKAMRLGLLVRAGLPVPDGFVIAPGVEPSAAELAAAMGRLGAATVAVRSSAEGEDGQLCSMAGMFHTELGVAQAQLPAAIRKVRASYRGRSGGVVVQTMIEAEWSGVLFTEDPAHAGRTLIELVPGRGEALVSGRTLPRAFRFGRISGEQLEGEGPPHDLQPLLALSRKVEALFGRAQDIEWVQLGGEFMLVQARDVTATAADGSEPRAVIEAERRRLLGVAAGAAANEPVFAQNESAELLPEPTPYSAALFAAMWEAGGTVDLACRAISVPYAVDLDRPPFTVTAFGRLFVDLREVAQRRQQTLGGLASFRFTANAQALEERVVHEFLPVLRRRLVVERAIDPQRLPLRDLLLLCEQRRLRFLRETYVEAEQVNVAAEFFARAVRTMAGKQRQDAAALLHDGTANAVSEAFAILAETGDLDQRVARFLCGFGHRAAHDFELAEPRYAETPDVVAELARYATAAVATPALETPGGVLGVAVGRARRFQSLKELLKHETVQELQLLRELLRAIGERCQLGDNVFYLLPAELLRLDEPGFRAAATQLAARRRAERDILLTVSLPVSLSPARIEALGSAATAIRPSSAALRGERVAGAGAVTGRVRVLRSPAELPSLQRGEILVTRCTDPCWMPAFGHAAAIVTEVGGWLSHAAIQARERNLPTIVGVADATALLRDGDCVRLHADGGIERIAERRSAGRQAVVRPATVYLGDRTLGAELFDLGDRGAGLRLLEGSLTIAQNIIVELDDTRIEGSVAWILGERVGVDFAPQASGLAVAG
ncbi:MAG TPA: PEP/pyruvate-binding domain-containing protein [Planctomycetota bacterium]|nr:PEP/pyruvate-binding domain-containing protein [Planctomycetota bacterium]